MKKFYSLTALIIFFFAARAQNPGDVIVTEFMADPTMVTDALGEWFEIYNTTPNDIDINGWILEDLGSNHHKINNGGPLLIAPSGFLLLANNGDAATNGGITPDYVYAAFVLANAGDEILLLRADSVLIDEVDYTATTPGKSRSLDPYYFNSVSNDSSYNWCNAVNQYGLGDYGTPRASNPSCSVGIGELSSASAVRIWFNNNHLHVMMHPSLNSLPWKVADMLGKTISAGVLPESSSVCSILLNELPAGVYVFSIPGKSVVQRFMIAGK